MATGMDFKTTIIPDHIKEVASEIITGLLREEGWELPGTSDEERTTHGLELRLLEAFNNLRPKIIEECAKRFPAGGGYVMTYDEIHSAILELKDTP